MNEQQPEPMDLQEYIESVTGQPMTDADCEALDKALHEAMKRPPSTIKVQKLPVRQRRG